MDGYEYEMGKNVGTQFWQISCRSTHTQLHSIYSIHNIRRQDNHVLYVCEGTELIK